MPARQNKPHRVKCEVYVLVSAHNEAYAKANAEVALRKAVIKSYESTNDSEAGMWASGWDQFSFKAVGKPVRIGDDE